MTDFHLLVSKDSLGEEEALRRLVAGRAEVSVRALGTPSDLESLTRDADAVIVALQPLRRAEIEAFSPRTVVIGRAGVGLDTIDLDAAKGRGVNVIHEPSYATAEVADHAAALLLCLNRQLIWADRDLRDGWATSLELRPIPEMGTRTLGVLGLGRIGRAFIDRMRPFVGRIIGFDTEPIPTPDGVEREESLTSLLQQSDILSLHIPLTAGNHHLIGRRELEAMPTGAHLINVSRGGLVDEDALADALESGHLSGAGLDVFEREPLPMISRLRTLNNIVLTPHIAGYSAGSAPRLAKWMLEDVLAHLSGEPLPHGRYAVKV